MTDGPRPALLLGSGLWHVIGSAGFDLEGDGCARETPFGASRPIFEAEVGGRAVLVMTRHGKTGYAVGAWSLNYRANLWALKDAGADAVLATSACGGIDRELDTGAFVVPHDVLDSTSGRAGTFFENRGIGVLRHADPFCPALREALLAGLADTGETPVDRGIYACTNGPRLETPAEVRAYGHLGATLVGMTLAPEFALARELELCYAAVCLVVNPAEGARARPYRPDVLFEGMATEAEAADADAAAARLPRILAAALEHVEDDRPCHCRRAMTRYRARGLIGEDFRTWHDPRPGGDGVGPG